MNLLVTSLFLVVPSEQVIHLLLRLTSERGSFVALPEDQAVTFLIAHLHQRGWVAEQGLDGDLYITEYRNTVLDLDRDQVLESLVGCVKIGSFLQGYQEGNNEQWQLRYYAEMKSLVKGSVIFPREPVWEQQAHALIHIREALPQDSPQLRALSPVPLDWEQGTVLVAERAGVILALLQYQIDSHDAHMARIMHIATRVRGAFNGYPQAIVQYLQRHFQRLIIEQLQSPSAFANYKRVWKQLGFIECDQEASSQCGPQISYVWWEMTPIGRYA